MFAATWAQLLINLEEILLLSRDAKLNLNLEKCSFGLRRVEYLGYILGQEEVRPGERKIKAIEEFPKPTSQHEIRRFLGLTSFFRRFVENFARIAAPLSRLLKKEQEFIWAEEQEQAFLNLKNNLLKEPVLKMYNPRAVRTELHTDASAVGLGALLIQSNQVKGLLKLVYAISRRTTDAERHYHSSRLELCVIA